MALTAGERAGLSLMTANLDDFPDTGKLCLHVLSHVCTQIGVDVFASDHILFSRSLLASTDRQDCELASCFQG